MKNIPSCEIDELQKDPRPCYKSARNLGPYIICTTTHGDLRGVFARRPEELHLADQAEWEALRIPGGGSALLLRTATPPGSEKGPTRCAALTTPHAATGMTKSILTYC